MAYGMATEESSEDKAAVTLPHSKVVIACAVFRGVIENYIDDQNTGIVVMDYGLHLTPQKMRAAIQQEIDKLTTPHLVLIGFGLSTPTRASDNRKPAHASAVAQFRSIGKYDGYVREYADDYWYGNVVNSTGSTIVVGDDFAKRLLIGVLDFDTSTLPDTAIEA